MTKREHVMAILIVFMGCFSLQAADEIRYLEKDGVTYREIRTVTKHPVQEIRTEERRETVLRDRYTTEMQESFRTVYTPVTEYRWQPRVHGAWNPLVPNHVAYHLVPHTYWKPTRQSYQVPLTRHEVVPVEKVVRMQVPTVRFAERVQIDRVPISTAPSITPTLGDNKGVSIARRPRVGSTGKILNDPPRQGTRSPAATTLR